jgi:23S rRNA (adenine2503-C2)-methyltransferase
MDEVHVGTSHRAHLTGYDLEELTGHLSLFLEENGHKPYRAKQIVGWLYNRGITSFNSMHNLPEDLRDKLGKKFSILSLGCDEHLQAKDGTEKFLWFTEDAHVVESVYMPSVKKATICLSTQVGCTLKCSFCATGDLGHRRNLKAHEIVSQALAMRTMKNGDAEISNVVFMGMGEPMLNYGELIRAIRIMNNPELLQIGARRITVSTVGIPQGIRRLAKDFPQVKLAVSLNAPLDSLRDKLMPINRRYPLRKVIEAVRHFTNVTGKRVTFGYIMIPGVNDSRSLALSLRKLIDGIPAKVNLMTLNRPGPGEYRAPTPAEIKKYREMLMEILPQPVTLRKSMGAEIQAACGLLAGRRAGRAVIA